MIMIATIRLYYLDIIIDDENKYCSYFFVLCEDRGPRDRDQQHSSELVVMIYDLRYFDLV